MENHRDPSQAQPLEDSYEYTSELPTDNDLYLQEQPYNVLETIGLLYYFGG